MRRNSSLCDTWACTLFYLANKGKCRRLDRIGDIESLPDITRALGQRLLRLPSKLGVCPVNLSNARADITSAATDLVHGDLAAGRNFDGVNDLADGVAGASAKVKGAEALELAFAGGANGSDVALGKIDN